MDFTHSSRRRTQRLHAEFNWKIALLLIGINVAIFSSVAAASDPKHPVLTQKIGFAGELREDEESRPISTSSGSNSGSSSNRHDIRERSPLFESGSLADDEQHLYRVSLPSRYHPNHRYPHQQPPSFSVALKKQPTSSIISEAAYYSPARRLEVEPYVEHHHHDDDDDGSSDHHQKKFQYGYRPSPSPTPIYKKIYRDVSPSPVAKSSYYTKKPTFDEYISNSTPHPEPKKYAFAYSVRDGHNGDDYSHKESRDGKVTMGEYKVVLPDGRLQVVRYTADAKAGFKADVTYEGDDHYDASHLAKPTEKPYTYPKSPYFNSPTPSPSSELRKNYIGDSPTTASPAIYTKYHSPNKSTYLQNYPSISPSITYKGTQHPQANNFPYQNQNSITPTPYGFLRTDPSPNPSPSFSPRNIYEKINNYPTTPTKVPYAKIPRGYPAGPGPSPTTSSYFNQGPSSVSKQGVRKHRKIIDVPPTPNYISNSSPSSSGRSRLIPIEHFKAGPYTQSPKEYKEYTPKYIASPTPKYISNPTPTPKYISSPTPTPIIQHHHHDEHFVVVHDHREEQLQNLNNQFVRSPSPSPVSPTQEYHHQPIRSYRRPVSSEEFESKSGIAPVKSSLATFTSILGVTPKPILYIKSNPLVGVGRAVKPSTGGLVYLETPGQGIRPTAYGVKEILDKLPHDNLPRPRTTTHPYQIGSKDYGEAVSYGHERDKKNKPFIPSEQIPNEYVIHHHHDSPELNTDHFSLHGHDNSDEIHASRNHYAAPASRNYNIKEDEHHVIVSYNDNH